MTRTANDHTFVIERDFAHPRSFLFFAFADQSAKSAWFGDTANWTVETYELDFREGGKETYVGRPGTDGPEVRNDVLYYQIVPDERIIISYSMHIDGKMITVSLQTLEFSDTANGSRLKLREQIVFLDGSDHLEDRIRGTEGILFTLGQWLDDNKAAA